MENGTSPELAVYLAYADAQGLCWPHILLALSLNAIGICGVVLNAGVIWTTWRNRSSLNGTANFLLALYSLFEVLHQSGHSLYLWTSVSGSHFIDYPLAVRLCTPSLFGVLAAQVNLVSIALDRLLVVLFPFGVKKWVKPRPYLTVVTLLCSAISALLVSVFYEMAAQMPKWQVTGYMAYIFVGRAKMVMDLMSAFVIASFVLYVALWLVIRCRKATGESEDSLMERHRRIFRSIFCILCINLGGYVLICCSPIICFSFVDSPVTAWSSMLPAGILVNISAASNGPILYWTSEEYRTAFQKEMSRLKKMLCSRQIQPTPQQLM